MISEGSMTAEDYLEAHHQLRVEQQMIREEEQNKTDELEAEQLNNLRQVRVWSVTGYVKATSMRVKVTEVDGIKPCCYQP